MTTIGKAIDDLLNNGELSVEEAVDRHFAPGFRQRVNGTWSDRAGFVAGIVGLREKVEGATVDVLDEVAEGSRYAERHTMDLMKRDGGRILQEVYMFGERDSDGRFARIEEVTLPLPAPSE